jgi:tyrosyl-tRNA synthetase
MNDIVAELTWRGLVHQTTDPELGKRLAAEKVTVYCGFDPSSDSLHVGNLMGLLNLRRFQQLGHKPIALAGGGTGFIGDPSGKTQERSLLTVEQLEKNLAGIKKVMSQILDFSPSGGAILVNNADWLRKLTLIDFLRDVGKHFTVNVMLEKESVRARLEDREHGISYTEFSYMLLQAYDFLHLYEQHGCRLQVGGSDQFGNITAGCELIRRVNAQRERPASGADGLTWPLLTRSDGKKFGKTESGAIWLSADRTSPYEFYQYWINTPDSDAGRFLRYFTDLGEAEIRDLETKSAAAPQERIAQRAVARSVTELVHGVTEREKAEAAAAALFSSGAKESGLSGLDEQALLQAVKEAPSGDLPKARLEGEGILFLDLMVESKLWPSRGEAKRAVQGGGANLNNVRVADLGRKVTTGDLLHGKYLVLRKGKKDYFLFRVNS